MSNNAEAPCATMDDVLSAIGADFYAFMAPRDLVSVSQSNRFFSEDVCENLFLLCSRQQRKLQDEEEDAAASVVISREHSFAAREELAECLLDNIKMSNLRYVPPGCPTSAAPDTLDETLALTRADLSDESNWGGCAWYGTFKSDPAEIWKPLKKPFGVGCRFMKDLQRGRSRKCFIDFMLREMGEQDSPNANANDVHQVTRDWARFIIAQKGIIGREWQWKCDDTETVGFMVYTARGDQHLEIKLTKRASGPKPDTCKPPSPPSLLSAFGF